MMSSERGVSRMGGAFKTKQPWEPMNLCHVGDVAKVVRGGGGKLSVPTQDPGEPFRKPRGHD